MQHAIAAAFTIPHNGRCYLVVIDKARDFTSVLKDGDEHEERFDRGQAELTEWWALDVLRQYLDHQESKVTSKPAFEDPGQQDEQKKNNHQNSSR